VPDDFHGELQLRNLDASRASRRQMDVGAVILNRFDIALLKCASCSISFDKESTTVQLGVRQERDPVVAFHEHFAADRCVAGPRTVEIGGTCRWREG
jgi:hypothetical protein